MIRILNAEPLNYSEHAKRVLRQIGELHERSLTREELLAILPEYDVLIVRLGFQVDRSLIDAGSRLKVIVTATTGLDHIDISYAQNKGIDILSLRGETEFLRSIPATAEHTWALLLSLVRYIPSAFASVCQSEWRRDSFRGRDLCGKRLGIVGLGRIGEKMARYGIAFQMQVIAWDPYRQDWMGGVDRKASLNELLGSVDILTLHVPLTSETKHMIGHREIGLLPAGAFLVNTSRGAVIEEIALLEALENGHLAGAALDVMEIERRQMNIGQNPLLRYARDHSNLLITPHIGGATVESMEKTELFMANKLKVHPLL